MKGIAVIDVIIIFLWILIGIGWFLVLTGVTSLEIELWLVISILGGLISYEMIGYKRS